MLGALLKKFLRESLLFCFLVSFDKRILAREVSYIPGLFQIFYEILVNAADNIHRNRGYFFHTCFVSFLFYFIFFIFRDCVMGENRLFPFIMAGQNRVTQIRVHIDLPKNQISVWNDGYPRKREKKSLPKVFEYNCV